jgi:Glycosyl hydrolase family 26
MRLGAWSPWRGFAPWLGVLLVALLLARGGGEPPPAGTLGVYRGAGAAAEVAAFERWAGGRAAFAVDFLPWASWAAVDDPSWWAARWERSQQRLVYSVPLLVADGSTLQSGAAGAHDGHFEAMARTLVAHGQGDAILRLGWEFNGGWFPWNAGADPEAFVASWRRAVEAIRRVPGAEFRFDWTANLGTGTVDPERAYPGDAYVDIVGLDVYDQGWWPGHRYPELRWRSLMHQPHGLVWHRDFARAHDKPLSFPEWGLTIRPDGHGGGDNAYYVERMHEWISANDVAYHSYFEYDAPDGSHRLMNGQFPVGAKRFRELFGTAGDH